MKGKCYRKIYSIILIISLLFLIFKPIFTYAAPGDDPLMENGFISWQTEGKKATSSIYYRTIGWTIHKERIPSGNVTSSGVPYGNIMMQQVDEYPSSRPGFLITEFESSDTEVKKGLNQVKDKNGNPLQWKNGETVYLSAIMEVRQGDGKGGYRVLGTYKDLSKVKASQPWANPSDFDQYFNKALKLDLLPEEVHKIIKVNGKVVADNVVVTDLPGTTHNVQFDKLYNYNGRRLEIKKSYFERRLEIGKQLFPLDASDPRVTNRNVTIDVGGMNVIAEYQYNPLLTVEHMDKDSGTMLDTASREVPAGTVVSEKYNTYTGKQYIYSEISIDGGKTWSQRSDKTTRSLPINVDTIIRFYYSANVDLIALLNLTASPNMIEKGKTATVDFLLDASASKAKNGIAKYEFWFGDKNDFDKSPDYVVNKSNKKVTKSNVAPNTKWYGKVRITDTKGNTSEATAEVLIGELEPEPTAEVKAALSLNVVQNSPRILRFDNSWGNECFIDIFIPNSWKDENGRYGAVKLDFTLDASKSESTNGVGNYKFFITNYSEQGKVYDGSNSSTDPFKVEFVYGPQDVIDGTYDNNYWSASMGFRVEAYDSVVTTAKDDASVILHYKYFFEKEAPTVDLSINANDFGIGEDALFTPTFTETKDTYPIENKWWEIYSENGNFQDKGTGEIPGIYELNVAEGKYIARQYISYKDNNENDQTLYAEVKFNVWGMRPPDVSIKSDKNVYIIPTEGLFTVTYEEHPKYSYPIEDTEYKLKNKNGTLITQGKGTFPEIYPFDIEMDGGFYIAEQTIYWYELGELKSKTASCEFKLISPKPASEFRVDMKMTNTPTWNRIDVPGESGKQFKQIRIDLSPSIALNESLENPYPVDFTSPNTQIQIIPLAADGQGDRSKNSTIHTPNAADKQLVDDTITFKGKQFIDVRFDSPGKYRIKVRVANQHYVGNWLTRDITIREDLAPKTYLSFEDVLIEGDQKKVYRNANDLRVRFKVKTKSFPQDEDTINSQSAKLQVRFDYNADGDTSNDNAHSNMIFSKSTNTLQPYINIQGNDSMDEFNIEMYSNSFPILGKMRFEYFIAETSTIPNFTGGSMPAIPELFGDTFAQPIDEKLVWADNKPGNIKIELGKDSKIEITIIMGTDSMFFDVNTLKAYYGESARIYVITKNGDRQLIS